MQKISFNGGEFVSSKGELNYEAVLADFKHANIIRILTYNISKNEKDDKLLGLLKDAPDSIDVQIITNIPSRFPIYYNSSRGQAMRTAFRNNCDVYLGKLNPNNFQTNFFAGFNFDNHAKIIGTENIVYIGSANYSNESKYNIETGILIRDKEFIEQLYSEFFEEVREDSVPYFDDEFNTLRLFVVSMEAKFKVHINRLMESVFYIPYNSNAIRLRNSEPSLSRNELYEIEADIDEVMGLSSFLEDTYSEEDDQYNELISDLLEECNKLSLDWMLQFVMEDSEFCNYIKFNIDDQTDTCLEEYSAEAYDEYLEEYVEKATEEAQDIWESIKAEIEPEAIDFIEEIKKLISKLELVHEKLVEVAERRVNKEIDNT